MRISSRSGIRAEDGTRAANAFAKALIAGSILTGCNKPADTRVKPAIVEVSAGGARMRTIESPRDMPVLCKGYGRPPETRIEVEGMPGICVPDVEKMMERIERIVDRCKRSADFQRCVSDARAKMPLDFKDNYFQYVTPVGGEVLRSLAGGSVLGIQSRLMVKAVSEDGVAFFAQELECVLPGGMIDVVRDGYPLPRRFMRKEADFHVDFDGRVRGDANWLKKHAIRDITVQDLGNRKVRIGFHTPETGCD